MSISTATLNRSVGVAMGWFGDLLNAMVGDASAVFRTIYGIADGKDYGRYFAGQDPLVPFANAATSVDAMIAQGVEQRRLATEAINTAIAAASDNAANFAAAVFSAVETVRNTCANPVDALRILERLTRFDGWVYAGTDAIGYQIQALSENASVLMRRASAISLARASADYVPPSQNDAAKVRDLVSGAIDRIATEAADRYEDESYHAMNALRVAVIEDLNLRGGSLAPVVTRTLPARQPAVVLAYKLYQDADRAGDLLGRNDPPHPSWLPTRIEALAS